MDGPSWPSFFFAPGIINPDAAEYR